MQVKKFEARTMNEALEMVKTQLGPDAIILSARDNRKSFGLVGQGSVEITAAISETTLQKKKFVESKMRDSDRERFSKVPARLQKEIIERTVNKQIERAPKPITTRRYADIEDEGISTPTVNSPRAGEGVAGTGASLDRESFFKEREQVKSLLKEIDGLRSVISQFQSEQQRQSIRSVYPGHDYGLVFELSFMFEKLTNAGMSPEFSAQILQIAFESIPAAKLKSKALVEAWVTRHLLSEVQATDQLHKKVQIFVGPPASGKTTNMVKLASHLVVNEGKKVALVTADVSKVGGSDQLKIFAQILNVPFAVVRGPDQWNSILKFAENLDYLFVDMPGLSLKSGGELETLKSLIPLQRDECQVHLVLSSSAKDQDCTESGRRYSLIGFDDVFFTGLDESVVHGNIYNFQRRFSVPLFAFGIGPRVPEDFEFASSERVVDLLLGLTKQQPNQSEEL